MFRRGPCGWTSPWLCRGGAVKQQILSYHMTPVTRAIGHRSSLSIQVLNMAKISHCVHIAHAEARILTQEYLSPV